MSYTDLDWLHDQTRENRPFTRAAYEDLLIWLREDGRCVIRISDVDALVAVAQHAMLPETDLSVALDHWHKNRKDWV